MSILQSLTKDMAQIMEREMTRADSDPQRLYATLLLLIGWRRDATHPKAGASRQAPEWEAEADLDAVTDEPAENDAADEAALDRSAFEALKEDIPAFRHGNPYINGLLFRDFRIGLEARYQEDYLPGFGTLRIHAEAPIYLAEVLLCRALRPATGNAAEPTNMHKLLERLCRLSGAEGDWADTQIRRERQEVENQGAGHPDWFRPLATALQAQHKRLGDNISAIARNSRSQYGAYRLRAGDCAERVGEELMLHEVLDAAPKPLRAGFTDSDGFKKLLGYVIDSLNYRYALLRKCGLKPQDWLHQEKPSISRLEQLAELRAWATTFAEWQDGDYEAAFRLAFEALSAANGGRCAGFQGYERTPDPDPATERRFREARWAAEAEDDAVFWVDSRLGQAMLEQAGFSPVVSLDALAGPQDIGLSTPAYDLRDEHADSAEAAFREGLLQDLLRDAGPRLAENPVLHGFIHAVLIEDWDFADLLDLPRFREAQARHPRYAGLDETHDLPAQLFFDARALIAQVLLETETVPIDPLVREYLLRVIVEETPPRGKNGLFNRKSFKTLLAQYPLLSTLPPDELAETLERKAMGLLESLLRQRD